MRTLEIIRDHPGRRAGDLSALVGMEKLPFKLNVRKLKALGLTESLEIGYRLSPRGAAFMQSTWTVITRCQWTDNSGWNLSAG